MIIRRTRSRKKLLIGLALLVVIAGAAVVYRNMNDKNDQSDTPSGVETVSYLNFDGNYVFSVPKDYNVDEQSVPGAQLIYTGQITAKTLEDVYNAGGFSMHAIADLTDHSGKAFKKYVNDKYLPELKKNLSTNDVQVKFGKANEADNAIITVKKDGKQHRYIFLKGGQHPAAIVAKQESSAVKDIERTLIDVEKSDLKTEQDSIKKLIKDTAQLIKDQKTKDLYAAATPELKADITEAELATALKTATPFTEGNIVINGVVYTPKVFSVALRFTKLDKNDQLPAIGSLSFKKVDGQWKLEVLQLPTPPKEQ